MSQNESMGTKFFSLPYERDGYGSLECLIERNLDVPDREFDDHHRDFSRTHIKNHDVTLLNCEKSNNTISDLRNVPERCKKPTRNLEENSNYANDLRISTSSSTHHSNSQNLIDLDNNEFRSCNNLENISSDFIDFNERNFVSIDSNASHVDFTYPCKNSHDFNQRDVDLRNRRNCNSNADVGQESDVYQIRRQFIAPNNQLSDRSSSSLPDTFVNYNDRSTVGGNGYGSLPGGDIMSSTDTLTYCVHGKPGAGCCATLLNQPTAPTINISIDEHCHVKERDTGVNKKARRQIIVVSSLCLFFMICEAVGGYLSGSLAIATDAAHLLTDFAGFMISLFALYVAARKPSRIMPFGWHRAEVIGAMLSVLTIWLVTGILVYLAVQRLIDQNFEIDATVMLITSAVGVVVNIIMALTLHQHSHASHAHACSHSSPSSNPNQTPAEKQNINVRAAFIHIIGDLLQSVGVFIAATIIYYKPEYVIVDPICTFLFSILVLATTFNIMKDALLVLMEGIPRDVDFNDVLSTLLAIDGVIRVHNLRIWALSLDKTALSAHLAIAPSADCTEILKAASKEIHKKYNFFEMTLQIEYFHQNMETCAQCQVPT